MPPGLWEKGVGAEADAVACILAGNTDNIRLAVAFYAKGYHYLGKVAPGGIAVLRLSFFF